MSNGDDSTVGRHSARRQGQPAAAAAVDRRLRAARRQGRPQWPWPGIDVADWRRALAVVESATRDLLGGNRAQPLRTADPRERDAFGLAAYTSGMGPWLGYRIETGALEADDRCAALLAEHLDHSRRRWIRLERELQGVLAALREHAIEPILLKGAWGARRWFAEPALRPLSDIDLLVERADMSRAERVLAALDYREKRAVRIDEPPHSVWRRNDDTDFPHSLMFVHADDPIDIDLHGSLDSDFHVATVPFETVVRAHTRRVELDRGSLRVLTQPLLSAHHAVHASGGNGLTLVRLTELALMLRQDFRSAADWRDLDDLLGELHARRFAWPALHLTELLAPGSIPDTLLARCRSDASPRLRSIVDALTPASAVRLDDVSLRGRFMWASGPREHARRIGIMLLPTARSGSLRQLGRIYLTRAYQLLRRRVRWLPTDD